MKSLTDLGKIGGLETSRQLEIVDQLRELGVGEDIALPMLVVVGDQSSGKSSVLEGLTNLPFPVAGQLCTRFATQVSFRRSAPGTKDVTTVSIVPSPLSDESHRKKVLEFAQQLPDFDSNCFQGIIGKAASIMGLDSSSSHPQLRFSPDVLKFEISGSSQQHLSIVDVPGLYHNPTEEQTAEDLELIRTLISRYITDPKAIIMAVLDATHNLAMQGVFKLARDADEQGTRTVGIMTKLDIVQQGDESAVLKIARNESYYLNHGWYCVRNRKPNEVCEKISMDERHANEQKFFEQRPWRNLSRTRVGIQNLKKGLGRLLAEHISREFPSIRKDIDARLSQSQHELEKLGVPRTTFPEQMLFLTRLTVDFQILADSQVKGIRSRSRSDLGNQTTLRTKIQTKKENFAIALTLNGATLPFKRPIELFDYRKRKRTSHEYTDYESESQEREQKRARILNENCEKESSSNRESHLAGSIKKDIYDQIYETWTATRGTELAGHVNPSVVEELFYIQTSNWGKICKKYLQSIQDDLRLCFEALLTMVCPDKRIRGFIQEFLLDDMEAAMKRSSDKLHMLLEGERKGPLHTNNHYFADNIERYRSERQKQLTIAALPQPSPVNHQMPRPASAGNSQAPIFGQSGFGTPLVDAGAMHLGNQDSVVYDIHDSLKSYYQVALKRFIDNFGLYVVEQELLGAQGPLRLISPQWVSNLDISELASIVGEDSFSAATRSSLQAQVKRLQQAQQVCRQKLRTA